MIHGAATLKPGPVGRGRRTASPATDVVLATGSRPRLLPGLEVSRPRDHERRGALVPAIPASAVIIGAGAIGLEFASFYRSMGAEVTVVEALPGSRRSRTRTSRRRSRGRSASAGSPTSPGARQTRSRPRGPRRGHVRGGRDGARRRADVCLVAVGRGPVTDGPRPRGGRRRARPGFVKVDGQLHPRAPHVWAVGDVAATPVAARARRRSPRATRSPSASPASTFPRSTTR